MITYLIHNITITMHLISDHSLVVNNATFSYGPDDSEKAVLKK